jgi:hypothetical protein
MFLECSEITLDINWRVLQGATETLERSEYGPGCKT